MWTRKQMEEFRQKTTKKGKHEHKKDDQWEDMCGVGMLKRAED